MIDSARLWTSLVAAGLLAACQAPERHPIPLADARWAPLETGSDANLRGVCAVGDGVVWASGSDGTVLRSVDGGERWRRFEVPGEGPNDLRDIEALDARRAWVISITEPARVLATDDGGASWEVLYTGASAESFFDSIALFDADEAGDRGAVVFGDPQDGVFEVVRSDDGVRWSTVEAEQLPPATEGEAAFAASGTCVVTAGPNHAWIGTGGARARVLRSTDAGRTWTAAQTPMRQGGTTTGIYSVAFFDALRGVVLGGQYDATDVVGGNAAWTDDGGVTWHAADEPPSGYRSGVAWLSETRLLAVGRAGGSYSADGGRRWTTMYDDTPYYAVSVAPDGDVFAVGSDGRAGRLFARSKLPLER